MYVYVIFSTLYEIVSSNVSTWYVYVIFSTLNEIVFSNVTTVHAFDSKY